MFENGRKTIGVILCDVSSHYQEQICQTLSMYAKEADYNLAYFTTFTDPLLFSYHILIDSR